MPMNHCKKLKVAIAVIAIATISSIEPTAPTFSQTVELRGPHRVLQAKRSSGGKTAVARKV